MKIYDDPYVALEKILTGEGRILDNTSDFTSYKSNDQIKNFLIFWDYKNASLGLSEFFIKK